MAKEEGVKHLKDHLFHGLKPNLCNTLHYMYDKPESQYSQLVMSLKRLKLKHFEVVFLKPGPNPL